MTDDIKGREIEYLKPRLSRLISFLVYEVFPPDQTVLKDEFLAFRARGLSWDEGYPHIKKADLGQPSTVLWRLRASGVIYGVEKIPEEWVEPQ